jgi:hypothetical protein
MYTTLYIYSVLSLVRMKVRDSDVLGRIQGQREKIQVLGSFGLLNFTTLRSFPDWHAFWNLWNTYFFNFPFIRVAVKRGYWITEYGGRTVLLLGRVPVSADTIHS